MQCKKLCYCRGTARCSFQYRTLATMWRNVPARIEGGFWRHAVDTGSSSRRVKSRCDELKWTGLICCDVVRSSVASCRHIVADSKSVRSVHMRQQSFLRKSYRGRPWFIYRSRSMYLYLAYIWCYRCSLTLTSHRQKRRSSWVESSLVGSVWTGSATRRNCCRRKTWNRTSSEYRKTSLVAVGFAPRW